MKDVMSENTPEYKPTTETFNPIDRLSIIYLDLIRDIYSIRFDRNMNVSEAIEYAKTSRIRANDAYTEIILNVTKQYSGKPLREISRDLHNQIILMQNAFKNLFIFVDIFINELKRLHSLGYKTYAQEAAGRIKRLRECITPDFVFNRHEISKELMHIIACREVMHIIAQSDSTPSLLQANIKRYLSFTKTDMSVDNFFLTRMMWRISELEIINNGILKLKKQITEFQKESLRLIEIYGEKYKKGESDIWDVMIILQSAESHFEDMHQSFSSILQMLTHFNHNHNSSVEALLAEYIKEAKSNIQKTGKVLESMRRKIANFGEKHIKNFLKFVFSEKGEGGKSVADLIEDRYQRIKSDIYSLDVHLAKATHNVYANEPLQDLERRLARFSTYFTTPSDFIDLITELLLQAHPELSEEISAVMIKEEDIINSFSISKSKYASRFEKLQGVLDGIKTGLYIYERDFDDVKRQLLKHYPLLISTARFPKPNIHNEILKVLRPIKHLFLYMKKIDGGYDRLISDPEEHVQLNEMMRIFEKYYTTDLSVSPTYLNKVIGNRN